MKYDEGEFDQPLSVPFVHLLQVLNCRYESRLCFSHHLLLSLHSAFFILPVTLFSLSVVHFRIFYISIYNHLPKTTKFQSLNIKVICHCSIFPGPCRSSFFSAEFPVLANSPITMVVGNLKLGVDVVSAHNLLPKDGQGSSSAFVELCFDGQRYRSTIKEKDLNPVWNESFYFNISNPSILHALTLDAYIYNHLKATQSRTFLGKVSINGTSFVPSADAVVLHYPLEKRGIFSRVRGELGLKVYVTDDPSIKSSVPIEEAQVHSESVHNPISNGKNEAKRHTFHTLPKREEHDHSPAVDMPHHNNKYVADHMKAPEPIPAKLVRMHSASSAQPVDYALKETSPFLGGGRIVGGKVIRTDRAAGTYDLVEKMHFLFVRVVKARELPAMDVTGSLDPYVEVRIGNYKGITKHIEKQQNPMWNVVFAFSKERMQASVLEVVVKDKDLIKDDFVGVVLFDLNEVPMRVPPDSPLAPEWYRLDDKKGEKIKGELMLAVWIGTQADEAFPDAWHSDAA